MATIEKRRDGNGNLSFRARVRRKGFAPVSMTFKRRSDATKWARKKEAEYDQGKGFGVAKMNRKTLAEAIDRYCEEILPVKAQKGRTQRQQLQWWKRKLGHHLLYNVSQSLICDSRDKFVRERKAEAVRRAKEKELPEDSIDPLTGHSTANRYLAALSHVFTIALEEWNWAESNPVGVVRKLKEPSGRSRFLNNEELKALLEECKTLSENPEATVGERHLYLIVLLAVSTGMRKGEILDLTWSDIDLNNRRITIKKTKNGEIRSVPLVGKAFEEVKAISKVRYLRCKLLFPGKTFDRPVYIGRPWIRVLKKVGIEDFRFHDLRHTAASYLAMNGASVRQITEILGHKTLAMAQRYSHLSDEHLQDVVESMNMKVFG